MERNLEKIVDLIKTLNFPNDKTFFIMAHSNYKSKSRKIISPDEIEYEIIEEVDDNQIKTKKVESVSSFLKKFTDEAYPYKIFRCVVMLRNESINKWITIFDTKNMVLWK